MTSTGLEFNCFNDYSNNFNSDISCNNLSVLNNIRVNSLTTDKTRILNDGTLEVYFAGSPALPTKDNDSWWSVIDELSQIDEHLISLDLSITGHTTALSEVNLAAIIAQTTATAAQTTATSALNLATTNSTSLIALSAGMVGLSIHDSIKQTITSDEPIHVDENVKIS